MAYIDPFADSDNSPSDSGVDCFTPVQLVQQAMLTYPTDPLCMFAAVRGALFANKDMFVESYDCTPKNIFAKNPNVDLFAIGKLFSGSLTQRRLFNGYPLTPNDRISIFFATSHFDGTYLISIMESPLGITVTVVTDRAIETSEISEKLWGLTTVPVHSEELAKD